MILKKIPSNTTQYMQKDLADVLPSVRSFNMYNFFPENRFVITQYSEAVRSKE